MGKPFTTRETKFLKNNYTNLTVSEISKMISRTTPSITAKVSKMGLRKQKQNELFIDLSTPITNKFLSYMLGYFWADAHLAIRNGVRKRTFYFSFEILADDFRDIKPCLDKICQYHVYSRSRNGRQPTTMVRINNQRFCKFLSDMCFANKSKMQPTKLLSVIDISSMAYFYRGYFDGDGCTVFSRNFKSMCFSSCMDQDWSFVEDLYRTIGVKKFTIKRRHSILGSNSSIEIYNFRDLMIFGGFLYGDMEYEPIGLNRKYSKFQLLKDYFLKNLGQPS